jgi:hypothetical protein
LVAQQLVHATGRFGASSFTNYFGGNTCNRRASWHVGQNHGAGSDPRTMADFQVAKHFRTGANEHTAADFRMTVPVFLARPTKGHALQQRYIVFDNRRSTDDNPGTMVYEYPLAGTAG